MCGCLKHTWGWSDVIFLAVAFIMLCLLAYVGCRTNGRDTSYFVLPFLVIGAVGLVIVLFAL